jgi:glycosyltransferase 2 family protein
MILSLRIASERNKKLLKMFLKIAVTALCFIYVVHKINFSETQTVLKSASPAWLLPALAAFILSKAAASLRLNYYFRNIGIQLGQWQNLRLYWLGMFYNLFLPGSVGGDAYKAWLLAKQYQKPLKQTASAVLLDRLSGLLALCVLCVVYWWLVYQGAHYSLLLAAGAILLTPVYYMAVKYLFRVFLSSFWITLAGGFVVQLLQLLCMFCVLQSLHIEVSINQYMLIFLISSVFAVLPITIGGLGAREVVFVWGASVFGLNNSVSVMASLLFYFITVLSSLPGLPFIFIDPLKRKRPAGQPV